MNSTIPLLGGVPFYGGEGAFRIFFDILRKSPRKKNKKMRSSRRPVENTGLIRMTYEVAEITTSSNQRVVEFLAMTDLNWA
jgi:predicted N-acyltransferase